MHGTGHRPDPEAVRQRRAGFHLLKWRCGIGASALPLSTNNRAFLATAQGGPGMLDQDAEGGTSSCEGHGHASAITLRFAIKQKPIKLVSPDGIYKVARMISRVPNADGTLPPLQDTGTEPSLVIAGIQEWGVCSADTWGYFPVSPATINLEPTPQQLMADAEFKLNGAYFMQSSGDQFVTDLMTALAAGFPVTSAIAASGSAFQQYTGGVLGALDDGVDHASLWVDFTWNGTDLSSVVFYGVNSWGVGWGESDAPGIAGGMYRFNRDFAAKYAQDACVIDVSSTGSEA